MNFVKALRTAVIVALVAAAPAIVGLASASSGGEGPGRQVPDKPARVKSGFVSLDVGVSSKDGQTLKNLPKDDFTVYEDGVKQSITKFSQTDAPFTVLLLLDLSGSTAGQIALMKSAADGFLAHLRSSDSVGVATFSNGGEIIADFQDDRKEIRRKVSAIATPEGNDEERYTVDTGTSFYDALDFAVKSSPLSEVEGRKALVCISDGVDSSSSLRYVDIAGGLERSGTSLYFLKLDTEKENLSLVLKDPSDPDYANFSRSQLERYFDRYEPDPYAPNRQLARKELPADLRTRINGGLYEIARQELGQMAERTGGRVYPVSSVGDLSGVFDQVAADLHSQYSIGYRSTNQDHDGKWRTIRVEVNQPGAVVHARSGYRAPGK
jgi:VWFA-related protein